MKNHKIEIHKFFGIFQLFYVDDMESQFISKGFCSFCRTQLSDSNGTQATKSTTSSFSPEW